MPRQYMLALGGGIVISAVIIGLVLAAAFAGYLTNPTKPLQVALANSADNQGPQGIFDAEIYQCAAALPREALRRPLERRNPPA